jgi:hypothetical protein
LTTLAVDTSVAIPLVVATHLYDALAAVEHGADLATRDARARSTYEAVGVRVVVAAPGG